MLYLGIHVDQAQCDTIDRTRLEAIFAVLRDGGAHLFPYRTEVLVDPTS